MAGRIPQNFIDDLLMRVNIIDVLADRVQKFKRTGKNYSGLCPFHKENTPSFTANQDKQFYYCFGCGAGGNAIGFLMDYENIGFPEAVEALAAIAGLDVPKDESIQQQQKDQQVSKLYKLLENASLYYQQQLKSNEAKTAAVSYLKSRGLSGEIAKIFNLGFAPPGWNNLLQHSGDTPERIDLMTTAGLTIYNEERNSHYDRFRNRIIFPIRDQRGRVMAFGGRVLGNDKPKYLNSPETPTFHKGRELYGLYEARKQNTKLERLLIVEGYMDVISLAQFNIHYAVATLGTATSSQHLERLFKLVPEIVFSFDGDEAGRNAAKRALKTTLPVIKDGLEVRFLFLPDGEDPDSLVRKEGKQKFEQRIKQAQPLSEFFFSSFAETANLDSMDGRARFSTQVLPAINSMQSSLLQKMMLDRICELTHLSLEQIQTTANFHQAIETPIRQTAIIEQSDEYTDYPEIYEQQPYNPAENYSAKPNSSPKYKQPSGLSFAEKLISLFLHYPQIAGVHKLPKSLELTEDTNIKLLYNLDKYFKQNPSASLGQLTIDWRADPELTLYIKKLFEISTSLEIHNETEANQYLKDSITRLSLYALELEINDLQSKQPLTTQDKLLLAEKIKAMHSLKSAPLK